MTTITTTQPRRGHAISVIARKEIRDAFRNRLFIIALVLLLGLSLTAVTLGALSVRSQMADYLKAVDILTNLGRTDFPAAPPVNPLAVS
ncbi:MAG: hypothetical protein KC423_28890, partial [Anaerolineales bacterium]|nr:hypothetical protein [Anaerolineales bacterium]